VEDALRVEADVHWRAAPRGRRDLYSARRRRRKRGSTAADRAATMPPMENEPGVPDRARPGPEADASPHLAPDPAPATARRSGGAARLGLFAAAALLLALTLRVSR